MNETCFFWLIFFMILSLIKSSVSVELEASTRLESVDIEAESTKIITTPIKNSGRRSIIAGIIASNPSFATSSPVKKSLPNPPKK